MNFISRIPYKHLTLFVIATLAGVFIGIIITETYLSSSGVQKRTTTFYCLVDYLKNQSITDDYFPTESFINDDAARNNCRVILKQFDSLEDIANNLYSSYNTAQILCKVLEDDKTKKLCKSTNDVEGSENQSQVNNSCINVNDYLKDDEISKYETSEGLYVHTRNNCEDAQRCFSCINESLIENDSYMIKRLHTKAINITIVNFEVWRYFQITSKVNELLSETSVIENDALKECKEDQKCSESSSVIAESKE